MGRKKIYRCLPLLVLLSACSWLRAEPVYQPPEDIYIPPGAYAEYGGTTRLRYYKNVLSPRRWRPVEILDYSQKRFPFPPLAGYRVLHYENPLNQTRIDLYREVLRKEKFLDLIVRRGGSDHCSFTRSLHSKWADLDLVQIEADCHIWFEGRYRRKYYFVRAGNVVYTFRLLALPEDYLLVEADFDYFVNTTIDNYLLYAPRRQFSPDSLYYFANAPGNEPGFSREELLSFFAPPGERRLRRLP